MREVAAVHAGSKIHPFADVAVAEKPVVIFVTVAMNDARFDLAADPAMGAERGAGADLRAEPLAVGADQAFQPGKGTDDCSFIDHDWAARVSAATWGSMVADGWTWTRSEGPIMLRDGIDRETASKRAAS